MMAPLASIAGAAYAFALFVLAQHAPRARCAVRPPYPNRRCSQCGRRLAAQNYYEGVTMSNIIRPTEFTGPPVQNPRTRGRPTSTISLNMKRPARMRATRSRARRVGVDIIGGDCVMQQRHADHRCRQAKYDSCDQTASAAARGQCLPSNGRRVADVTCTVRSHRGKRAVQRRREFGRLRRGRGLLPGPVRPARPEPMGRAHATP
jgi:hypothetical protein